MPLTLSDSASMGATSWIMAIFLALGLAASCGLNTFVPLLMLAGAAKFHLFGVHLGGSFTWLGSDAALGVLALAAIVEIVGDKIPVIDHALDVAGTFSRPVAGALAAASVLHGADPTTTAVLGLIIGAPAAFGFHAAKAGTRAASSATTLGLANPILSTLEDFASVGLVLVSLLAPVLVPLILLLLLGTLALAVKRIRKRRGAFST